MISIASSLLAAALLAPSGDAPVQRPRVLTGSEAAPTEAAPTEPAPTEAAPTEPAPTEPGTEISTDATADVAAGLDVAAEPATDVAADSEPAAETTEPGSDEQLRVATERPGPPYYTENDLAQLRARHGLDPASPPPPPAARWRCLIADPTCRHSVELQAMGAYALRARQGDVRTGSADRWHSMRAQYDVWLSLPALVETAGKSRFTKMSMGPKGGVIFSDGGDLWGNVGMAMRYWMGRGRWAPSLEITSALSFKLGSRIGTDVQDERFRLQRGPVGFSADVGFGLGGFGAIVFGGQYDSPLAREEVPEEYRVVASGMFYVGFRGNILWGGPAAAAVAAQASGRAVQRP